MGGHYADDPASALAQHVCRTGYADLPASAVESARRDLLDTFGCMLGGSGSPGIGELFTVTIEAADPIGSPQKPLTDAQFEAKFRDCARNAVRPLSDASIDAALARIARLEALCDARELMVAFSG